MTRLEYLVSATVLRVLSRLFAALPVRNRTVLATARTSELDGNLFHIHQALRRLRPKLDIALVLEPYSYRLFGKLAYAARLVRGTYLLQTSRLVVVDNAYLPVHVAPHRAATQVVQVWHAEGALKRFGMDAAHPPAEPERTFLHRRYDWVVTSGEASREAWSRAFRTPIERVLALGSPRTDLFFDATAMAAARDRIIARYPVLAVGGSSCLRPTFRGRGKAKRPGTAVDIPPAPGSAAADGCSRAQDAPELGPRSCPDRGLRRRRRPSARPE